MVTKTISILMPKGYFISWFVTTQAGHRVTVTLSDDKKTYFSKTKQNTNIDPPLDLGYATVEGNDLKVRIDVEHSTQLKERIYSNNINKGNGEVAGMAFTLCMEDYTDDDYNDIVINIIGWVTKG